MSFRQKFRDLGIIAFVDTIEQAFKFALDYSQRRAQFVSDIRHQVTAKPIVAPKALGHGIKGMRQRPHGRRPPLGDPNRIIACRYLFRRFHDAAKWYADAPHHSDQRSNRGQAENKSDHEHQRRDR
jgi:hypothetical protein